MPIIKAKAHKRKWFYPAKICVYRHFGCPIRKEWYWVTSPQLDIKVQTMPNWPARMLAVPD